MRLTGSMLTICAVALLSSCSPKPLPIPVETGPLFCDVEEPRRFSHDEIEWRSEHAPWNLRKDLKTNATHKRECVSPSE